MKVNCTTLIMITTLIMHLLLLTTTGSHGPSITRTLVTSTMRTHRLGRLPGISNRVTITTTTTTPLIIKSIQINIMALAMIPGRWRTLKRVTNTSTTLYQAFQAGHILMRSWMRKGKLPETSKWMTRLSIRLKLMWLRTASHDQRYL